MQTLSPAALRRNPFPERPEESTLTDRVGDLLRALHASPCDWRQDCAIVQAADMLEVELRRVVGEPVIGRMASVLR